MIGSVYSKQFSLTAALLIAGFGSVHALPDRPLEGCSLERAVELLQGGDSVNVALPSALFSPQSMPGVVEASEVNAEAGNFTGELGRSDKFASSITSIGDIDGNGVADIAVGVIRDDDGAKDAGAVYILRMNADGTVLTHTKLSSESGFWPQFELNKKDHFGYSVASIADLNGDGRRELVVGAPYDDSGERDGGAIYVLFLHSNGMVLQYSKISGGNYFPEDMITKKTFFGASAAGLGDLDGDGFYEIAVGAIRDDATHNNKKDKGAVYIISLDLFGLPQGYKRISDLSPGLTGVLDKRDEFGRAVANIGDVNGDGIVDLAVGAPFDDDNSTGKRNKNKGAVYIFAMNSDGGFNSYQKISDLAGSLDGALPIKANFGMSLAGMGTLGGSGTTGFAAGAPLDDDGERDSGSAFLISVDTTLQMTGYNKLSNTYGGLGDVLKRKDYFGSALSMMPDINGDGIDDLLSGAPGSDAGPKDAGSSWIIRMGSSPAPSPRLAEDTTASPIEEEDVDETMETAIGTSQTELTLYPNPNDGSFNVNITNIDEKENRYQIEVINAIGQVVDRSSGILFSQKTTLPMRMNDTQSGLFFVRVTIGEQMVVQKMLVE